MVSMVIMAGILIKFISSSKWFVKERERKENHFTSFILLLLLLLIDFQMDDLPLLLDKIKHINKLSNFFLLSQSFKVFFLLFFVLLDHLCCSSFFSGKRGKNEQTNIEDEMFPAAVDVVVETCIWCQGLVIEWMLSLICTTC